MLLFVCPSRNKRDQDKFKLLLLEAKDVYEKYFNQNENQKHYEKAQ